jgi:hypothetical protein
VSLDSLNRSPTGLSNYYGMRVTKSAPKAAECRASIQMANACVW